MKRLGLALLVLLVPSLAFASTFSRNLQLGSIGPDVAALQRVLNEDPATALAMSGPGSPGNETQYFGPATKQAVIKFQEKYKSVVLSPNNLLTGTGLVGPSTRSVLELLAATAGPAATPTANTSSASPAPVAASNQNPNFKNADALLAAINSTATKQGYSKAQIDVMEQAVLKELATTTDLSALFFSQLEKSQQTAQSSYIGKFVAAVNDLLGIRHAEASIGIPFGGTILTPFYCNQSNNWMLTLKPVGPTYATLLSYFMGTEAFDYHTLPFSLYVVGTYSPPGICTIGACPYCVHIPTWGTILPETGSSAI